MLIIRKIHRLMYLTAVVLFFVPVYPLLWFFSKKPNKYYNQIVFFRKWISIFSTLAVGIKYKISYESDIDWSKPYVLCPNHFSFLDISCLTYLCPKPFSFVGKIELLNNPITGIFFKTIDIPIDRRSKYSAYRAFSKSNDLLKQGKSLVIFPEGKIDDFYPPILQPFKHGAFKIAQKNNVDILPIVIHDAWEIMWDDGSKYGSKPGVIHITVLDPIKISEVDIPTDHLEQEVFEVMRNYLIHTNQETISRPD